MTIQIDPIKIIVALDTNELSSAISYAKRLDPKLCRLKVGKELFTAAGPIAIEKLMALGFEIFLDLKFHDIPNTVKKACSTASELGVWMLNVHALGGKEMLCAAKEGISKTNHPPLLIAVTLLTSHTKEYLHEIGITKNLAETVLNLAQMAKQAELDGVVCSAQELQMLHQEIGMYFCYVVPGIRWGVGLQDDQKRIATPKNALNAGASYLVIGRPIMQSTDPGKTLRDIYIQI